jgi:hypothetical protein
VVGGPGAGDCSEHDRAEQESHVQESNRESKRSVPACVDSNAHMITPYGANHQHYRRLAGGTIPFIRR